MNACYIPEIKFSYCISLHNTDRKKGFAGPGSVGGKVKWKRCLCKYHKDTYGERRYSSPHS